MTTYIYKTDDFIEHHGIKGQKWGVRRYQNSDGSLTDEGLKRYANKNLKKATVHNLNKWGADKNHNVLYIIGASGSGKSTTALGLSKKRDSIVHLDTLLENEEHGQAYRNKDFENFCISKGIDINRARDINIDKKERWKVIDAISDQIEPYGQKCYSQGKQVIIEGVQMADDTMFPDKTYFKDRPVITLRTNKTRSAWRAATRDKSNFVDLFKDFTDRERSEWYDYIEEGLNKIDDVNRIQHSSVFGDHENSNDILMHHGIKGQKWGVRRYQNSDGSYTSEGRKRHAADAIKTYRGNTINRSRRKAEKFAAKATDATRIAEKEHPKTVAAKSTFLKEQSKQKNLENQLHKEENKKLMRNPYKERKLERKLNKQHDITNRAESQYNKHHSIELNAEAKALRYSELSKKYDNKYFRQSRKFINKYGEAAYDKLAYEYDVKHTV